MTPPVINLRRIRSFDEILSATFQFIRLHFRPLGVVLALVAGFPIMVLVLCAGIALSVSVGAGNTGTIILLLVGLQAVIYLFSFTLVNIVAVCYMGLYEESPEERFSIAAIWRVSRRFLVRATLAVLLCSLITVLAAMFFIIPGIYVAIGSSLTITIIVFEDVGISAALDRSFRLMREHWWQTFGILAIISLVLLMVHVFLRLPGYLFLTLLYSFTDYTLSVYFLVNLVSTFLVSTGTLISFFVPSIALSFQYFSLVERKEAPGLMERIRVMAQTAGGVHRTMVISPGAAAEE